MLLKIPPKQKKNQGGYCWLCAQEWHSAQEQLSAWEIIWCWGSNWGWLHAIKFINSCTISSLKVNYFKISFTCTLWSSMFISVLFIGGFWRSSVFPSLEKWIREGSRCVLWSTIQQWNKRIWLEYTKQQGADCSIIMTENKVTAIIVRLYDVCIIYISNYSIDLTRQSNCHMDTQQHRTFLHSPLIHMMGLLTNCWLTYFDLSMWLY